ncbi:MAG: type IV pilus twitching motility protein PilT [Coriobacteriaceae bacterium]|nr:type IV pilus twitching motility protein PilT [Coriobacteriaceae bacterium]
MNLDGIILKARDMGCSDVHISAGEPVFFRQNGTLVEAPYDFKAKEVEAMIEEVLDKRQLAAFDDGDDLDFALVSSDGLRQRVNVFRQRGHIAATIRLLDDHIPTIEQLGLPSTLNELADRKRGLILVTGPTGSGKSTTLAAMIDYINRTRAEHIITIEDPIEYVYTHKSSLIHQREVGHDTKSFAASLRSALREDPDIILVGEMRDYETISAALTAAETGHLVMSTLHTTSAALTVDRIIDACPAGAQNQVRSQLSGVLAGVITQCLIPTADGLGRCAATEVLVGTDAVLNMVREDKIYQLDTIMQSNRALGMHTLNADLMAKVRSGVITAQSALEYSNDRRELTELLG